jgi:hypothetical protein
LAAARHRQAIEVGQIRARRARRRLGIRPPAARLVKQKLSEVAEVRLWNEEIFEPGLTAIESIEQNFKKFELRLGKPKWQMEP